MPHKSVDPAPPGEISDEQLVEQCRHSRDERAFAELVRRYRTPVFRLAVSILGQPFAPEAEDVAQDVMMRVHHGLPAFRAESKFSTWVYRITFNQALNVKTRMRFRAPHLHDAVLETAEAPGPGPDLQLEDKRRRRAVQECMAELPEVYQSALRLHYWLGASMTEIAEMLDTPVNTVKSYLHRARQLLHAMLIMRGFDGR